ncbi:uncharacterized protein [Apostichopus japonicus]
MCPGNITQSVDPGENFATVVYSFMVYDSTLTYTLTANPENNSAVSIGVTTATLLFEFENFNDSCSFPIIVIDTEPPKIRGCRTLIIQSAPPSTNYTSVFWLEPSATDAFPPVTVTKTHAPFDRFYIGFTNVTYTFTDANGNEARCHFEVWVQDNTDPIISSCPSDDTVAPSPGNVTATVSWVEPTATDNSGTVITTASATPPAIFGPGVTTVTYDFSDPSGNMVTCSFEYNVEDTIPPEFSNCPNDAQVTNTPTLGTAIVMWVEPTATDNNLPPSVSSTSSSGDLFDIGVTDVIYTATDSFGLETVCNFTVTVVDNEDPVVDYCPGDIEEDAAPGQVSKTISWFPANATDNSGSVSVSESHVPGSEFTLQTTRVRYTFTDPSGNDVSCIFDVTLNDGTSPVFSGCPSDIATQTDAGRPFATVDWTAPVATDESGTPLVQTTNAPNSQFLIGVTEVIYTAMDAAGNVEYCAFNVTVIDDEPPVLNDCPLNTTLDVTALLNFLVVSWEAPTVTENDPGYTLTSNVNPGISVPIGSREVTYLVVDPSGNEDSCSFTITVEDPHPPTISNCPVNLNSSMDLGEVFATVVWAPPTATDNDLVTLTSNYDPGDTFPDGTTTVTYVAVDPSGNMASCDFNVTVDDREPPSIMVCPTDFAIGQEPGEVFGIADWTIPTVTDNVNVTFFYQSFIPPGQMNLGSKAVSYLARDDAGNQAVCAFIVTVLDTTPPGIRNCPNNMVIQSALPGLNYNSVFFREPVAKSESNRVTVTSTHEPFDNFTIGTTPVVYTFTDSVGNQANCTFMVLIQDNELPVIEGCPMNISYSPDPINLNVTVNWTEPIISDNSGMETVTQTHTSPILLMPGVTEVLYRVVDPSGNSAECRFFIGITDKTPPMFTSCPNTTVVVETDVDRSYSSNVTWTEPVATDNTLIQGVTSNYSPGQNFTIGSTTVTYTAVDVFRLMSTCSFVVIVEDRQAPVFTDCPSDIRLELPSTSSTLNFTLPATVTFDNSGEEYVTCNLPAWSILPYGQVTVLCTVTDPAWNSDECSFNVSIAEVTPPTFLYCPGNMSVNTGAASSGSVSWGQVTVVDNNGPPMLTTSHTPGEFPVGTTLVEYTATDIAGNIQVCAFNVTVIDDFPPYFIDCPDDQTVVLPLGESEVPVTWPYPLATEENTNGGIMTETTAFPNSSFPSGNTTVTITATDNSGNMGECSFVITVVDNENPTIECSMDYETTTILGKPYGRVTIRPPMTMDNVGVAHVTTTQTNNTFDIGNTTVVFTAVDYSGNEANCSVVVSVIDDELPMVENCPGDIVAVLAPDAFETNVTWELPEFSDNDNITSVTANYYPGNYSYGIYRVVYEATDPSQNVQDGCSFSIEVQDNTPPVIMGCLRNSDNGSIFEFPTNPGRDTSGWTWSEPVATDNGLIVNVSSNYNPPHRFELGSTVVTYVFSDQASNQEECSFTVSIYDDESPVIGNCTDVYSNVTNAVDYLLPQATDNVGITETNVTLPPGSVFPEGTTEVSLVVSDAAGNIATCIFNVTVSAGQRPVILDCPPLVSIFVMFGEDSAMVTWLEPTANGTYGPTTSYSSHTPGSTFPVGVTTVNYTFVNDAGLETVCQFDVVLTELDDMVPPVFTNCPSPNVTLLSPVGEDVLQLDFEEISATDNSNRRVDINRSTNVFPVGSTNLLLTAVDVSGNSANCTFDVIVIQDEIPQFDNCTNRTIEAGTVPGGNYATVTWPSITASDESGPVTVTTDFPSGSNFTLGKTRVTNNATDDTGNYNVCYFFVSVTDIEPPEIFDCPGEIVRYAPMGVTVAVSWSPPNTTDNSGLANLTSDIPSGSDFTIGMTEVTYTATDAAGLSANCTFVVNVLEDEPPTFTNCPVDQTLPTDEGEDFATAAWTAPTADDRESSPVVESNYESSDEFPLGNTTVEYVATDSLGQTANCSFDIIVNDLEAPEFVGCPANQSLLIPFSSAPTVVRWIPPTAVDNDRDGGVNISSNANPGDSFNIGMQEVTYLAVDSSGNENTCSFVVFVEEDEPPTITGCPEDISLDNLPGQGFNFANWTVPNATDANSIPTLVSNYDPGALFEIGVQSVKYTATDNLGSQATCTFSVTVSDVEDPVLTDCPSRVIVYVQTADLDAAVFWTPPTATDNSGKVDVVSSFQLGQRMGRGSIMVTYTARDDSNNIDRCNFRLSVRVNSGVSSDANILLQRVRGEDAPFMNITGFDQTIFEDLDKLFRGSEIGSAFFGLTVDGIALDDEGLAAVALTLFSDPDAGLGDSDFESAFDSNLGGTLRNTFDVDNQVPAFRDFYVGNDICDDACLNGGNCTRVDRDTVQCSCPPEWTGDNCETDVDECETGTCPDQKICVNYEGSFTCNCPIGQFDVGDMCVDAKQFSGSFNIAMLDDEIAEFTDILANPTSDEFLAIAERVQRILDELFSEDPTYIGSLVTSLSSGSIRVAYILSYIVTSPMTEDELIATFNDTLSDIGEIGDSAVFIEPLEDLLHEICPTGYCLNGGNCYADPETLQSTCVCQVPFIGDRCEDESFIIPLYIILLASLAAFLFIFMFFLCCVCCLMQGRNQPPHYPSAPPPGIFAAPPVIVDTSRSALYPGLPVHHTSKRRKQRSRRSRRHHRSHRRDHSLYELDSRRHRHIEREPELYHVNHGFDNPMAGHPPAHGQYPAPASYPAPGQDQQPTSSFATPYVATGQEEALLQERLRNSFY